MASRSRAQKQHRKWLGDGEEKFQNAVCVIAFKVIFRTNAMNVRFLCGKLHKDVVVMLLPAISDWLHLVFTFFLVLSPRTLFAFFGIDNDFTHTRTHTHERVFTPLRQFCFCFYETRKYRFPEISCQKHFEARCTHRVTRPTKALDFPPEKTCYGHFFCDVAYLYLFSAFVIESAHNLAYPIDILLYSFSGSLPLSLFSLQLLHFIWIFRYSIPRTQCAMCVYIFYAIIHARTNMYHCVRIHHILRKLPPNLSVSSSWSVSHPFSFCMQLPLYCLPNTHKNNQIFVSVQKFCMPFTIFVPLSRPFKCRNMYALSSVWCEQYSFRLEKCPSHISLFLSERTKCRIIHLYFCQSLRWAVHLNGVSWETLCSQCPRTERNRTESNNNKNKMNWWAHIDLSVYLRLNNIRWFLYIIYSQIRDKVNTARNLLRVDGHCLMMTMMAVSGDDDDDDGDDDNDISGQWNRIHFKSFVNQEQ